MRGGGGFRGGAAIGGPGRAGAGIAGPGRVGMGAAQMNRGAQFRGMQGGPRYAGNRWGGHRWHGGHHHRRHYGGFGLGLATGALIGSSPYWYDSYAYGGGYYGEPIYEAAPVYGGGSDIAYCQQRFKSYDVRTGTYLGYDGQRHPCP